MSSSYSGLSIAELAELVKGLKLEPDWLKIGSLLKNLSYRANPRQFKEVLADIGISDRTAAYLVAIVTRLNAQMIHVPQGISWRKMAEVAPALTYENRIIIFKKILSHTREELIEMRQKGTLTKTEEP